MQELPPTELIARQVGYALAEDVGSGDLTTTLLPADEHARVVVVTRQPAVLCGCAWFDAIFRQLDSSVRIAWQAADSDHIYPDQVLCHMEGNARALLTGERTALNYLQTLSGTATCARRYAEAVAGTGVRVLDTRKTLPGLRLQQKYAITCGGCHNHRVGLYDAILIKENHIRATGSITRALAAAHALNANVGIEIEVENLDELEEALMAGAKHVLLDNFSLKDLGHSVALNRGRARLEASGGVSLETIRDIAETGVDDISVGDLTKNLQAIDLSLSFLG